MNNPQKVFVLSLLLTILGVLVAGSGVYVYKNYKVRTQSVATQELNVIEQDTLLFNTSDAEEFTALKPSIPPDNTSDDNTAISSRELLEKQVYSERIKVTGQGLTKREASLILLDTFSTINSEIEDTFG